MRIIKKITVLGSGVMGAGIAAHLANAGYQVQMLDLPTKEEGKRRNAIAEQALSQAIKQKPAPFYHTDFIQRVTTGNFEDDLPSIKESDWIIEVIVEKLEIKKALFEKVDIYRSPDSIISSNTSGIPIHSIAEGRSESFRKHFLGTHFFNPPRYLRLLEIIPTPDTDPGLVSFMMDFGDRFLGKQTVLCKDTPAFIANRIGVYSMARIFQLAEQLDLPISIVDKLTGPAIGRPNTGTFRLADLVGHDTGVKVMQGIQENCPEDEQAGAFDIPGYMYFLLDNKFLGNKTGQGFYKKAEGKDESGGNVFLSLNLKTLEYEKDPRMDLPSLALSKQMDDVEKRIRAIYHSPDAGGQLIKQHLTGLFSYISNRVPEISDRLNSIDDAMKAGFAWSFGPFEYWDIIGVKQGVEDAKSAGLTISPWVEKMIADGHETFYINREGKRLMYDILTANYISPGGDDKRINLSVLRGKSPVYKNDEAVLHDIGDGVLCFEFKSKSNVIGEGILRGINESIRIAEEESWKGLVIGNHAANFSVGANLMLIGMMAFQEEWDELESAVHYFQQTSMRCRYSSVPVVAATQGYVFGGGCEISMHCDAVAAAAESYIGLVEAGVGLIPGGGGTKEFAVRLADSFDPGDVQIPSLIERCKNMATASVSTSAYEAFDLGYLMDRRDEVVINASNNITEAKNKVLELSSGYVMPLQRKDILVLGRQGLASLYSFANEFRLAGYGSEHDIRIVQKLAWVLCGGDLTGAQLVTEQYLLDLEREAFLSLCGEQKTQERIQYMLEKNKPLRN
ncbi:MAG TPA: 3-hydroxyacyl-CoA dehydrogenase NAD-binding domain-containing protein [Saprospiraceae bacterium]|nr:3-hydroxyacyl-CoA dehydrogenase NAD-binding domain-containing protein [Saprospiraceae bacterium]